MAIRIHAILSEMDHAASRLTSGLADFSAATQNTKSAADRLASGWEGDARDAFVTEQDEAIRFYTEMAKLVSDYTARIVEAANAYRDTDAACAKILRSA
jgi:WXG100 family type VII secretion target